MYSKIKFKDAISLMVFASFVSILIFLMIEVIWAQTLKDTVLTMYEDQDWILNFLILSGFILSAGVSVIACLLSSQKIVRKYGYWSAILALICNLFLWILISYFSISSKYPEVTSNLSFIQKIIAFPRIMSYYSIYCLSNVTLLWLISQFTFAALFVLFLMLLQSKKTNQKYTYSSYSL